MLYPLIDLPEFPYFNILLGLSVICSVLLFSYKNQPFMKPIEIENEIITISIFSILSMAFANISSIFFFEDYSIFDLKKLIFEGGFSFLPGFLFFVGLLFIRSIFRKTNFFMDFSILSPFIALSHAIGRIGCSLAGCCYGVVININENLEFRFPARELESLGLFLLFFILFYNKSKYSFEFYLFYYGNLRFFLEFFRDDPRGHIIIKSLSTSQTISLVMIIISTITFAIKYYRIKTVEIHQG